MRDKLVNIQHKSFSPIIFELSWCVYPIIWWISPLQIHIRISVLWKWINHWILQSITYNGNIQPYIYIFIYHYGFHILSLMDITTTNGYSIVITSLEIPIPAIETKVPCQEALENSQTELEGARMALQAAEAKAAIAQAAKPLVNAWWYPMNTVSFVRWYICGKLDRVPFVTGVNSPMNQ